MRIPPLRDKNKTRRYLLICHADYTLVYAVLTDYTPQFVEIFTSLTFSSYNELHSKMEEFQSVRIQL